MKDGGLIEAPVVKADAGTQTDTHFMESNIVKSYEWNEWELRRKAIKLVTLHRNCVPRVISLGCFPMVVYNLL